MFPGGKMPGEDFMHSFYPILIAVVLGMIYALRAYMRGAETQSQQRMDGKTAIVTGANCGIGKEITRFLAQRGARVILACRDVDKGKATLEEIKLHTNNGNLEVMQLDLASLASVRSFAEKINENEERIDVLINNAGVMCHPQAKTDDGFELHFQTNYLGPFLLTHLLLNKLKGTPGEEARIVNLTANAYRLASLDLDDLQYEKREYKGGDAYAQSKLAVLLYTLKLSKELEGSKVTVYCANPGVVRTDLYRYLPFRQNALISLTLSPFLWFCMKNPKDGAQTPVHCAIAAEEKSVSGKCYAECKICTVEDSASNVDNAEALWRISMDLLKLSS